ncbi:hypothetical protein NHX12_031035 [Muraenolepis orangiensis]|uniref:Uncharacterized protein n=1 Tax=Muraenolepis orangiensis TaxID=630683 RepID=A0A9Q0EBF7_9TELE|nr:hypothetical protein NHX12_031035 [Muraenolepis orangiensis]
MPSAAGITALFQTLLLIGLFAGGVEPLRPPQPIRTLQEEEPKVQTILVQELARPRRQLLQELLLAQPHLVHDMGRPEVQEMARSSQAKIPSSSHANATQTTPHQDVALVRTYLGGVRAPSTAEHALDVVEVMERMVHLHPPKETQELPGTPVSPDPETEPRAGPGAADSSLEASGYSPSFPQASPKAGPRQADLSSPGKQHHAGLEEIPTALVSEAMPVGKGEGEGQASGNGIFRSSVTVATPASSSRPVATEPTETETGTDFGPVVFAGSDTPRDHGWISEEWNGVVC